VSVFLLAYAYLSTCQHVCVSVCMLAYVYLSTCQHMCVRLLVGICVPKLLPAYVCQVACWHMRAYAFFLAEAGRGLGMPVCCVVLEQVVILGCGGKDGGARIHEPLRLLSPLRTHALLRLLSPLHTHAHTQTHPTTNTGTNLHKQHTYACRNTHTQHAYTDSLDHTNLHTHILTQPLAH